MNSLNQKHLDVTGKPPLEYFAIDPAGKEETWNVPRSFGDESAMREIMADHRLTDGGKVALARAILGVSSRMPVVSTTELHAPELTDEQLAAMNVSSI